MAYTEALMNMPGMAAAYCNRSGALLHLGDFAGAEGDATSALALDPGYAKAGPHNTGPLSPAEKRQPLSHPN